MKTYLVTVIADDRIGIIRDVTSVLFESGANLTDLRQNVMSGVFTLHCVAEFAAARQGAAAFSALRSAFEHDDGVEISFRAIKPGVTDSRDVKRGGHYVAAVSGPDRPGRIALIASVLARYKVNVEDWRHDLSNRGNALTIGLVTLTRKTDVAELSAALKAELAPHGLAVSLRHENIFRATNEVGPIDSLLG